MIKFNIGNKLIGEDESRFIVAEIGSNHNLDKEVVRKIIDLAAEAGFDAVKFQTYEPLEVFSGKITTTDVGYEKLYGHRPWWEVARDRILMPREWFGEMFEYVRKKNMIPFSTVHSVRDAEFIMQFDPPAFKVASIDVTYLEFLSELAKFKKPIILSTGMSFLKEVEEAVEILINNGNSKIALLHCVSCYPPKPETINLRNIITLTNAFGFPVGFSDHSPENYITTAAVSLGACIIEKHVTLDRNMEGPDHSFALNPVGMKDLVNAVREVERALGTFRRQLSESEMGSRIQIRRSIIARNKIKSGEILSREKLKLARPGTGIEPKNLNFVIGKKAKMDINEEEVIRIDMLE